MVLSLKTRQPWSIPQDDLSTQGAHSKTAAVFVDRAERIATSLKLAMFFRLAPTAAGSDQ
jgi:hypothetical protein